MGKALAGNARMNLQKPFTVCIFGYDEHDEGGRAWAIMTGLAKNGIIVKPCRTLLDGFFEKYRDLYRKWNGISGNINAMYVLFMGYYLVPLAWYLARRRKIPVILDVLVSQYDTEVTDRKRLSRYHPRAWFLWVLDWFSCHVADAIVVDTYEHKIFFTKKFFVNAKKILVVRVGCRSDLFKPLPHVKKPYDDFIVEFHGAFSPLQGVEYIIEAAKILQDRKEHVQFQITGSGQLSAIITALVDTLHLANVKFFDRVALADLPRTIARGDICLGVFGITEKALRVIPNKVYECMSCGKPVITERSPAALEVLHDYMEVCMVDPGNGLVLAEKILELKNDVALRARLAEHARAISLSTFSPHTIVQPLVHWLESHI